MSVEAQLDLSDPDSGLLGEARREWPNWGSRHPQLQGVGDLLEVRRWARRDVAGGNAALHTLAMMASPTGEDDPVAAGALAWVVLPSACRLAHQLRQLTPDIDHMVASQLWIEVRSFPWERLVKVWANVTLNTRREVLHHLGVAGRTNRREGTWARTVPVDTDDPCWEVPAPPPDERPDPAARLATVLSEAIRREVVTEQDVTLLLDLARTSHRIGLSRVGCVRGGLCAPRVSALVAPHHGVSPSTIRRRAAIALTALAGADLHLPGSAVTSRSSGRCFW